MPTPLAETAASEMPPKNAILDRLRDRVQAEQRERTEKGNSVDAKPKLKRPPSSSHCGSSCSTAAPKRARTQQCSSEIASSLAEDDAATVMSEVTGEESESVATGEEVECSKPCDGCFRLVAFDFSLLMNGMLTFAWLYVNGRGCWCRDCGNLWRCYYKQSMSLSLFSNWVAKNRIVFWSKLVAYLTLKKEGVGHVHAARVDDREATLRFAFNMCGFPYPIATLVQFDDTAFSTAAKFFMSVERGNDIMALVQPTGPFKASEGTRLVAPENRAERAWPLRPFMTADEQFLSFWKKEYPDFGEVASSSAMAVEASGEAEASSPKAVENKAELQARAKLDTLKKSVEAVVLAFLGGDNSTLSQKDFTTVLGRILRARNDLLESDVAPTFVEVVDQLTKVVSCCKKVVRPLREYSKSAKQSRLKTMFEPLTVIFSACDGENDIFGSTMTISDSLLCIFAKAKFYDKVAEGGDIAGAILLIYQDQVKRNMASALFVQAVTDCCTHSLLQLLTKEVDDKLFGGDKVEWKEKQDTLYQGSVAIHKALTTVANEYPLDDLLPVVAAYRTICGAAIGDTDISPAKVGTSVEFLRTSEVFVDRNE